MRFCGRMQPRRVAIVHDGYVPRYRKRLYELLGERRDPEYVIFHGAPPTQNSAPVAEEPFRFSNVEIRNHELHLGSKAVVWQGLVRQIALDFDALVIGAFLRFASSLALISLFKLSGRPVILWGQGADKREDAGALARPVLGARSTIKSLIARLGDGYLVYTDSGRERLLAAGLAPDRVFVVRNTLDMEEQIALHAELAAVDPSGLRAELGLRQDSVVLLYVGRLYSEKRVGELLDAARAMEEDPAGERPVEVVIVGDGPERARLEARAGGLQNVHFAGRLDDQRQVARHMRVAAAVVMPGKAGLAVNHAFGHGLPVITRDSGLHAPEVDYIESGRNGLIVADDLAAFTRALAEFAASPRQQEALAAGALQTRETLGVDEMAGAFDEGVRRVLTARAYKRRPRGPVSAPAAPPRYRDSSSAAGAGSRETAREAR